MNLIKLFTTIIVSDEIPQSKLLKYMLCNCTLF